MFTIHKGKKNNLNIFDKNSKVFKHINNQICCSIPDFSIGIPSNKCVNKIILKFESIDKCIDIFDNRTNYNLIWHHQVLFGFILYESNILLYDLENKYLCLFYDS